jgi:hypothetical protein
MEYWCGIVINCNNTKSLGDYKNYIGSDVAIDGRVKSHLPLKW